MTAARWSSPLAWAALATAAFVGLLLAVAVWVPLERAVHGQGIVAAAGSSKTINHPDGGIVRAIAVKNGDRVVAGAELLRFEDTAARTERDELARAIDQQELRLGRLVLEQADGAAWPTVAAWEERRAGDPTFAALWQGERRLWEGRVAEHRTRLAGLDQRLGQIVVELAHLDTRLTALGELATIDAGETERIRSLVAQRMVPETDLAPRLKEQARLRSEIAGEQARVTTLRHEEARLGQERRLLVDERQRRLAEDLVAAQAERYRLMERRARAEAVLARTVVTAPVDGIVHDLQVHTVGGSVEAGARLLTLVPVADELLVVGQIAPDEIDAVRVGMPADVQFTAFNRRTISAFPGRVLHVGADITSDGQGRMFYEVRVAVDVAGLRVRGLALQPGMTASLVLVCRDRTLWRYLLDPVLDQFRLAFREE
jgi:HlyD family type I secretion membrane fusion protein